MYFDILILLKLGYGYYDIIVIVYMCILKFVVEC